MDLKDKLLDSHIAFEEELGPKDSIQKLRNQALKTFEAKGFPSKKLEAWKYTSLN
ncbi:MAG: Fe-S cluster assembly protein SufD, partial [Flavobacteriaceae bacterium TMED120]